MFVWAGPSSLGLENAKDILAFGFNPKKTFLFMDTDYIQVRGLSIYCSLKYEVRSP